MGAGATLCKGLNRGLGTVLAGSLAFFIEGVANRTGKVFRACFIGAAVFLIGNNHYSFPFSYFKVLSYLISIHFSYELLLENCP